MRQPWDVDVDGIPLESSSTRTGYCFLVSVIEIGSLTYSQGYGIRILPSYLDSLVSSLDAPTTAYFGKERKAFFCASVPGIVESKISGR